MKSFKMPGKSVATISSVVFPQGCRSTEKFLPANGINVNKRTKTVGRKTKAALPPREFQAAFFRQMGLAQQFRALFEILSDVDFFCEGPRGPVRRGGRRHARAHGGWSGRRKLVGRDDSAIDPLNVVRAIRRDNLGDAHAVPACGPRRGALRKHEREGLVPHDEAADRRCEGRYHWHHGVCSPVPRGTGRTMRSCGGSWNTFTSISASGSRCPHSPRWCLSPIDSSTGVFSGQSV